jgi:hypothetical protein
MNEQLVTFKTSHNRQLADGFASILKEQNIEVDVEEDAFNFDPSYAYNALNKDYRVKIKKQHFF